MLDLSTRTHVHLVGVGGAGMSGLARILLQRGHHVTGTDLRESSYIRELTIMGATVRIGHDADAVGTADVVVRSSAVADDNPEVAHARASGIPVISRAELLAAVMADNRRVVVAGTHGKTTTTSMVVVALMAQGLEPGFAIGGQLNEVGTNATAGDDLFVAEGDESDRSLLVYEPDIAVVTNVEHDHPEAFADAGQVRAVFDQFLANRRPDGTAVVCIDDPDEHSGASGGLGLEVARRAADPVLTYGTAPAARYQLVAADPFRGEVLRDGQPLAELDLTVAGLHNLRNATAALAVTDALGLDADKAAAGLATFPGVVRRFQHLGRAAGVVVVDDYAHHPTELRATLATARAHEPSRVLLVVQPHRYSRTAQFGVDLGRAAAAADAVWVTEVYAAGEQPQPGVSGRVVADAATDAGARAVFQPHFDELMAQLAAEATAGDMVLVTGAGDVNQIGKSLVRALQGA